MAAVCAAAAGVMAVVVEASGARVADAVAAVGDGAQGVGLWLAASDKCSGVWCGAAAP